MRLERLAQLALPEPPVRMPQGSVRQAELRLGRGDQPEGPLV
jgi:hypothetical protein